VDQRSQRLGEAVECPEVFLGSEPGRLAHRWGDDRGDARSTGGNSKTLYPTEKFLVIYFSLRSNEKNNDSINSNGITLTDAQGRSYTSDYQVRQVAPDGSSAPFDDSSISPGATVALKLTFDVANDATGLVLHLQGGNDMNVS